MNYKYKFFSRELSYAALIWMAIILFAVFPTYGDQDNHHPSDIVLPHHDGDAVGKRLRSIREHVTNTVPISVESSEIKLAVPGYMDSPNDQARRGDMSKYRHRVEILDEVSRHLLMAGTIAESVVCKTMVPMQEYCDNGGIFMVPADAFIEAGIPLADIAQCIRLCLMREQHVNNVKYIETGIISDRTPYMLLRQLLEISKDKSTMRFVVEYPYDRSSAFMNMMLRRHVSTSVINNNKCINYLDKYYTLVVRGTWAESEFIETVRMMGQESLLPDVEGHDN